jgi:hypothetical protein
LKRNLPELKKPKKPWTYDIYTTGKIPYDFKESIIIPIPKKQWLIDVMNSEQ